MNSRPAHDELRAGSCQKQPASCSPAPELNSSTSQPLNARTNVECLGRGDALRPLDVTPVLFPGLLFLVKKLFERSQVGHFQFARVGIVLETNRISVHYETRRYEAERQLCSSTFGVKVLAS